MKAFHSDREAKEFLITKIVAEAERENVPLSEIERKMLYFTESGWTLPDMATVSENFDREYDQDEYEQKIAKLIAKTDKHLRKDSREEHDKWWEAIRSLEKQDHYISVMVTLADLRPRGDQLRLLATGLGVATCLFFGISLMVKYNIPMPSNEGIGLFIWAVAACLVAAYILLRLTIGGKRADHLTSKFIEKVVGIFQRAR